MSDPGGAANQFLREMKAALRPELINDVPDEFFQPSEEAQLRRRVMEIVDARLNRDKPPIGRQLRLRLIEEILTDIERARRER